MTYDRHLWKRALIVYDATVGTDRHRLEECAKRFMISPSCVRDWVHARAMSGKLGPARKRSEKQCPLVKEEHWLRLKHQLENVDCQLYIEEMAEFLRLAVGVVYREGSYQPLIPQFEIDD